MQVDRANGARKEAILWGASRDPWTVEFGGRKFGIELRREHQRQPSGLPHHHSPPGTLSFLRVGAAPWHIADRIPTTAAWRHRLVAPDGDGLRPVYCVELPVDAPGSLDADDTHEFDAAGLLAALQARARGRAWAMRLELELAQTASAAARVDLYLAAAPDEPLHLLHAVTQPGGGRRLTFGTGLVHTPAAVARLAGAYSLVQRTGDGATVGACSLQLGLTEYEFE